MSNQRQILAFDQDDLEPEVWYVEDQVVVVVADDPYVCVTLNEQDLWAMLEALDARIQSKDNRVGFPIKRFEISR